MAPVYNLLKQWRAELDSGPSDDLTHLRAEAANRAEALISTSREAVTAIAQQEIATELAMPEPPFDAEQFARDLARAPQPWSISART